MPNAKYQRYKHIFLKSQTKHVVRNRQYLWRVLCDAACVDCGIKDPLVIEFDHLNGNKQKGVGFMVTRGYALETIQKEIDKCEPVCKNCHAKRTHMRGDTWRGRYWQREIA